MKFKNFPEFLKYDNFRIIARMNQHTECHVTMVIAPEKEADFLSLARRRIRTEIAADSGNRLMNGIVTAVTVINDKYTITKAEITIISESLLLQEKGENRIYQNPEKTFADILKHYPEVETGKCEHLHDRISEVIYQYQTDDFTFLCFLAQKAGTALWITDDGKVSFGQINYQKSFSDSENILERCTMADYQQEEISILTMEQVPSGAVLRYQGKPYVIYQSEVTEEHQEAYFRYYASTVPSCYGHPILLNHWTAEAEVMDNKDRENLGRIQVKLNDWHDEDFRRVWIPYLSPYIGKNHGGIVMLPDIGDTVILHMLDGFFYAVGSIRKEALPKHCQNIEQKFFSMKNTLITLDETQIQFTEGEKSKFIMTEQEILTEQNKTKLTLTEQQLNAEHEKTKFTLQQNAGILETEKARFKIDTDTISAQTGSGKLQLENQKAVLSGSETKLSLNNGTAELSGTQINLNTQASSS